MVTTFIKLSQPQVARFPRLLHMEYTPRELALELECSPRQIHRAIEAGCPHREAGARLWIVGDDFATWYTAMVQERKRPLRSDEAFCLACRVPVALGADVTVTPSRPGVERVSGTCPKCGHSIHRYRSTAR